MQRCLMAGAAPGEFWNLCFEETVLIINGYYDRVNAAMQQTRLVIYTIACTVMEKDKRPDIYDFLPLKGDPTKEQRLAAAKAEIDQLMDEQKLFNDELRKELTTNKK